MAVTFKPCPSQLITFAPAPLASAAGTSPVDLLLLMACSENDDGKVEELLESGADPNIKDLDGKSPMELATKAEVKELLSKHVAA